MSYPATSAALVRAIDTKLADNLPPTQILRDVQAIIDHYKTTLVPDDVLILKVLGSVLAAFQDHAVATIDGRHLKLEDLFLDSHRITMILTDTTLGACYESRISLDHIETEPI